MPDAEAILASYRKKVYNPKGGVDQWNHYIDEAAKYYNLDPDLLRAQMEQESGGHPTIVSSAGATGPMQLMPGTAKDLGVKDVNDPKQNIWGGALYLRQQLDRYGNDTDKALAAYNAGPGNVDKYGGIPPFKETQDYVKQIHRRYKKRTGREISVAELHAAEMNPEKADSILEKYRQQLEVPLDTAIPPEEAPAPTPTQPPITPPTPSQKDEPLLVEQEVPSEEVPVPVEERSAVWDALLPTPIKSAITTAMDIYGATAKNYEQELKRKGLEPDSPKGKKILEFARKDAKRAVDAHEERLKKTGWEKELQETMGGKLLPKSAKDIPRWTNTWATILAGQLPLWMSGPLHMMNVESANFIDEAKKMGLSDDMITKYKNRYGPLSGGIEWSQQLLAFGPMKKLKSPTLKKAKGKIISKAMKFAGVAGIEGLEEVSQAALMHYMLGQAARESGWTEEQIDKNVPDPNYKREFAIGAGLGGIVRGVGVAAQTIAERGAAEGLAAEAPPIKKVPVTEEVGPLAEEKVVEEETPPVSIETVQGLNRLIEERRKFDKGLQDIGPISEADINRMLEEKREAMDKVDMPPVKEEVVEGAEVVPEEDAEAAAEMELEIIEGKKPKEGLPPKAPTWETLVEQEDKVRVKESKEYLKKAKTEKEILNEIAGKDWAKDLNVEFTKEPGKKIKGREALDAADYQHYPDKDKAGNEYEYQSTEEVFTSKGKRYIRIPGAEIEVGPGREEDLIEGIYHSAHDKLRKDAKAGSEDAQSLLRRIETFEDEMVEDAKTLGYPVPGLKELFDQVATLQTLGRSVKQEELKKIFIIPKDLMADWIKYVGLDKKYKPEVFREKTRIEEIPKVMAVRGKGPIRVEEVGDVNELYEEFSKTYREKMKPADFTLEDQFVKDEVKLTLDAFTPEMSKEFEKQANEGYIKERRQQIKKDIEEDVKYSLRRTVPETSKDKAMGGKDVTPKLRKEFDDIYSDATKKKTRAEKVGAILKAGPKSLKELKIGKEFDRMMGAISTRLKNINPILKSKIRKFEYDTGVSENELQKRALPFLKKKNKVMSKEDALVYDLAEKNRDYDKIKELNDKYNLTHEYNMKRRLLDDLYDKAKAAGFDVGYLDNFAPRLVKDYDGLMKYLKKGEDWSEIEKGIVELQKKQESPLTHDQIIEVINRYFNGYGIGVRTGMPGVLKKRKIPVVDAELNQFYDSSDNALLHYIRILNEGIASRQFFGKNIVKTEDGKINLDETIGAYVDGLNLNAEQENDLKRILKARFNPGRMSRPVSFFRNLAYMETLAQFTPAITQIGDMAFALAHAGPWNTVKAVLKKNKIKPEDVGVFEIAAELAEASKSSKALKATLAATGFGKIDRFGKTTLMNASFEKYKVMANKNPDKLMGILKPVFGDKAPKVLESFKKGEQNYDTQYMVFNDLLDFQPVKLSEMPEYYLTSGNTRILYMLKTYSLKLLDVWRNKVFQEFKTGSKKQAAKSLASLAGALIAMNMSADKIKDFLLNRETELPDEIVDNILKLFGLSKFVIWRAREEGIGEAVVKMVAPPHQFLDSVIKDAGRFFGDKYKNWADFDIFKSFPVLGKLFYWHYGRGKQRLQARQERESKKLAREKQLKYGRVTPKREGRRVKRKSPSR